MKKLCFATNNAHKLQEIRAILGSTFSIASLKDINCHEELEETQPTIEGNSLQKASFVFSRYRVPCFADDTGLEVATLDGAPGVISARYAGEHKNDGDNIRLLLKNLENNSNRAARFRTVITLITETATHAFEGILPGTIITEQRGRQGFGYDPVFVPLGYSQSLAEMSPEQKNAISHRAIAMHKLIAFLRDTSQLQA
jgi:XTP/dITP diphosphohydrolase